MRIAEERFSRWPVVAPETGNVVGYLLAKDVIMDGSGSHEWNRLIRPLRSVSHVENVDAVLLQMQQEGSSVRIVDNAGKPVGLVTLEDILEQVWGSIEDDCPVEAHLILKEAILSGGVVMNLAGTTRDDVIAELIAAIPAGRIPAQVRLTEQVLNREREIPTDLGVGVAIPHTRCTGLIQPLVVIGRSSSGVNFSRDSTEPVHLVFLLITPTDRSSVQLILLAQLARLAEDDETRRRLLEATTEEQVVELCSVEPGIDSVGAA